MRSHSIVKMYRGGCAVVLLAVLAGTSTGCGRSYRVDATPTHFVLDLALDPAAHTLSGEATVRVQVDEMTVERGPELPVAFHLHPALEVTEASAGGVEIAFNRVEPGRDGDDFSPALYDLRIPSELVTDRSVDVRLTYGGELYQDVSAGEKPESIHNFSMRAHVGAEGVYLAGGAWYPQPWRRDDAAPAAATFDVRVAPLTDIVLVGSAESAADTEASRPWHWRTPYPIDHFAVVGGPHEVHARRVGDVDVFLHLKPSQREHAEGLFETVGFVLDRYEPLIGAYPMREYRIVDNFFSSGFAFPGFTLLSSAVIDMGERARKTHGYIDHEMLHSWWGNGVLVDGRSGNWCESITSYMTNYYGFVLDGEPDEARRKRRNYVHFLSRLAPGHDKPLASYGLKDGCSRGIAYSKGAAVFDMLARKMGTERFFDAMATFFANHLGRHATWQDIQAACEAEAGHDLDRFFDDWVYGAGAPRLAIESAAYSESRHALDVTLTQGGTRMALNVPLRLEYAQGERDETIDMESGREAFELSSRECPEVVLLDPDYLLFRAVPESEIIPTTNTTRAGDHLVVVMPEGDLAKDYERARDLFASSFEDGEVTEVSAAAVTAEDLRQGAVLVLGRAALSAPVASLLEDADGDVAWSSDGSFTIDGRAFDGDGYGLLCTVHHPFVDNAGVTFVYGVTPEAAPKPMNIPFYEHSAVVFEDRRAVYRTDFEPRHAAQVVRVP